MLQPHQLGHGHVLRERHDDDDQPVRHIVHAQRQVRNPGSWHTHWNILNDAHRIVLTQPGVSSEDRGSDHHKQFNGDGNSEPRLVLLVDKTLHDVENCHAHQGNDDGRRVRAVNVRQHDHPQSDEFEDAVLSGKVQTQGCFDLAADHVEGHTHREAGDERVRHERSHSTQSQLTQDSQDDSRYQSHCPGHLNFLLDAESLWHLVG